MWLIGRSFVSRHVVALAVAALLCALAVTLAFGGSAGAHEYSPAFDWDEDETSEVANYNTQYGQQALRARDDYYANTDLDVDWCTYPCGANIIHYEANSGPGRGTAEAWVYSGSTSCFPVSYCNEDDHKADFAYIYWNSYYGPYDSDAANYLARHEMGHAFGLDHVPCSESSSVMYTGCSGGLPTTLQSHDISDMNTEY